MTVFRLALPVLLTMAVATSGAAADASGIDGLRWKRRVVLVSAPTAADPALVEQRRMLAGWQAGAQDRDVTVVQVVGNAADGVHDTAAGLRRRFGVPADHFAVLLIGKDGHVAVRSASPLGGAELAETIDAMPMRRAGQR